MKMMLLLVAAVILLVSPAVVSPAAVTHNPPSNLEHIIDLARKYNSSEEIFVKDVTHLAEGSHMCQETFFCKVHHILRNHQGQNELVKGIARNLKMYISRMYKKNCTEILHNMTPSNDQIPIPTLLEKLIKCSQHMNLHGSH
ncbi:uncharacterized protein ABDE67_010416 [Symphorus nematophorus]